jgi:hypothetical protein
MRTGRQGRHRCQSTCDLSGVSLVFSHTRHWRLGRIDSCYFIAMPLSARRCDYCCCCRNSPCIGLGEASCEGLQLQLCSI